jgi:hypothetical protein
MLPITSYPLLAEETRFVSIVRLSGHSFRARSNHYTDGHPEKPVKPLVKLVRYQMDRTNKHVLLAYMNKFRQALFRQALHWV